MTMADRNIIRRRDSVQQDTDPNDVSPQRDYPPNTSNVLSYDSDKDIYNLELSNSLGVRSGLSTRDSGYNTDLSPATTLSPARNTLPEQHFIYSDLDQVPDNKNTVSQPNIPRSYPAPTNPGRDCQAATERTTRSGAHLSPITRLSASRRRAACPIAHASSPSLSESSDTNRVQFDFESDDFDTGDDAERKSVNKKTLFTSTTQSRHHFDLSGNLINLHLHDGEFDEDDDDNIFYTCKDALNNWENASEPYTPKCRRRSQSMRERRYCSEDHYDEDSFGGAYGGCDPSSSASYFNFNQLEDQGRKFLLESSEERGGNIREPVRGSPLEGNNLHSNESISLMDSDSSLTGSQGFKPGYFDSDARDSDSSNVFSCDLDEGEHVGDSQANPGASRAVTISRERPTQRTISSAHQRRHGVTSNALMNFECLPSWCTSFGGVSVSTQTPHLTSVMIQQILHAPVPLPNEARGTAASRLHRLSESGVPLSSGPTPLPDIITSVGRDRSQSVPNLQTLANRHTAREVGRELRRLSDEFNFRRNLTPVNEEFDGHPASYPRMHPTHLRNTISQFGALLRDTFRGRHNSSN